MNKTETFIWQRGFIVFLLFFGMALIAFWPSYYDRLGETMLTQERLHGLALSWWCLLLILQAWLTRKKWFSIHRVMGYTSYVLVPFILISTHFLFYKKMHDGPPLSKIDLSFAALVYFSLLAFGLLYGLAIYHRKKSRLHARYMFASMFPMVTPVTDRIIGRHIPSLVPYLPTIEGFPVFPTAGFLIADVFVIVLIFLDWQYGGKKWVFPAVLLILILFQASIYTLYNFEWWRNVVDHIILGR